VQPKFAMPLDGARQMDKMPRESASAVAQNVLKLLVYNT
jgi:hypothetical protein